MEVSQWHKQDSTKLKSFMDCPRQYFFRYVLGWTSDAPNVHLIFGKAVHKAMEVILSNNGAVLPCKPTYDIDVIMEAIQAFLNIYRQYYNEADDEDNKPKNPANFERALFQYVAKYKDIENFDVLHIEVAGSVVVCETPPRSLFFKQDAICRDDIGVFALEHKTGSQYTSVWARQWRQNVQIGTYSHVLYCMYPIEDVFGVKINGIFVKNEPKKVGGADNQFERLPIRRTPSQMGDWLYMVNYWLQIMEREFLALQECDDSLALLPTFPKNPQACTKYFGCPYLDFCEAWLNPLQHCKEPPIGFVVEHWDPEKEFADAKEVVTL